MDDGHLLPYCEATIMEVQRISCVAPGGIPRRAVEDTWIGGYRIPKGTVLAAALPHTIPEIRKRSLVPQLDTTVNYSIYNIHTDRDYWGDPEVFRPERFLENDGKKQKAVRPERLVPFGFGKRVCMGQLLAKAELFMFTVFLIQARRVLLTLH